MTRAAVITGAGRWFGVPPEDLDETRRQVLAEAPLGRIAEPREIAYAVAWLASDEAAFVTGASLVVDGGVTARVGLVPTGVWEPSPR